MRIVSVWLLAAALLVGCGKKTEENNGGADVGPDTSVPDGADVGPDAKVGEDAAPDDDVSEPPEGVSIPGLTAPITVTFDEKGVLHVACATADDCFAAQGYYHAAHRFISMDIQRRFATGRLAELIGSAGLSIDVSTRALMSTRDGQPLEQAMWEGSSAETQRGITAYTRGVNAWIDDLRAQRNGATLSEEYNHALIPPDLEIATWTETDTIACGLLLLESLSNSSSGDLSRGARFPQMTPEIAFDLGGTMSATQVATMPASGEAYTHVPALRTLPRAGELTPALQRLAPHRGAIAEAHAQLEQVKSLLSGHGGVNGSNNWVLGGEVTASGKPILANDPHLGLQNPALWYLVELNATGGEQPLHLTGVSLPGMPGVLLGHNADIAWGGTVVFMDLADAYIEELTEDGKSVNFEGGTVEIIEVEHTFAVARNNPETRTLRFVPHHGAIVNYDPANNVAVSIRWTGNDARSDLDMFFGLFTATTVAEARDAIAHSTSTNQNWIVADRHGDIGWFPFNAVPERPWASLALAPFLPLPGDGSAEWGPRRAVDDLPQMVNPANHFIGTANTDPTGASFDGDPTNDPSGYLYSYGEVGGFRQDAVIKRIVAGGSDHTAELSQQIQADTFLVLRDWVLPHVAAATSGATLSPDVTEFWGTLENWDGTCPSGVDGRDPNGPKTADAAVAAASIGCTSFHFLLYALTIATFADELAGVSAPHASLVRSLVVLLDDASRLQGGDAYWDDVNTMDTVETKDEILLRALISATTRIHTELGSTVDDWRWGRIHTVLFYANLFTDASVTDFNEGPYAAPGGLHAINVADPRNPASGDWGFSHGPSMRHVAEFTDDGIRSYWTLPGGQRHTRDSPHYDDLVDDWLSSTFFEMPFTPDDVTAAAVETVTISPR